MSDFSQFQAAVFYQASMMSNYNLFRVDTTRDELWDTYINAFPEGTNLVYRKRKEYDCSCCKHFIRNAGNIVAIINGQMVSIWDIEINDPTFKRVANHLSMAVHAKLINQPFFHHTSQIGIQRNFEMSNDNERTQWNHFFMEVPSRYKVSKAAIGTKIGEARSNFSVLFRGLTEISLQTVDTCIELIAQNSIYRGAEFLPQFTNFRQRIKQANALSSIGPDIANYAWDLSLKDPHICKIRNSAIGTLMIDIEEGIDLDKAVELFGKKLDPANYKRPISLASPRQIDAMKATFEELGITPALSRRYAVLQDISINDVLYADRTTQEGLDVFGSLKASVPSTGVKSFGEVVEVPIENFMQNVLPSVTRIELMLENQHTNNLVSLIAPSDPDALNMLKWVNPFSWSYNGEVTDTMSQRVKAKGGNVDGDLRFTIQWNENRDNKSDLDAHCVTPYGNTIYYHNKGQRHTCSGKLDIDIQHPGNSTAVENIIWTDKTEMPVGKYQLLVHQYNADTRATSGFDAEIEFGGKTYSFNYPKRLVQDEKIKVASIYWDGHEFSLTPQLEHSESIKTIWGVTTQNFHKVRVIINSPNHWGEETTGNKHWFFMLDNCINDTGARGFYNEFLGSEMVQHRKGLEMLGSMTKVQDSSEQLSGLGFSSTKADSVICKITGSFNRVIKIIF